MQTWPMQQAKAHMSELVALASKNGPQEITVHGKPVAVILSKQAFDQITGSDITLLGFMQKSPLAQLSDHAFERDASLTRPVEL